MSRPDMAPGHGEPTSITIEEGPVEKARRLAEEAKVIVENRKITQQEDDYGRYEELFREREQLEAELDGFSKASKGASEAIKELEQIETDDRTDEINKYLKELANTVTDIEARITAHRLRIRNINEDPAFDEKSKAHQAERVARAEGIEQRTKLEEKKRKNEELRDQIRALYDSLSEVTEFVDASSLEVGAIDVQIKEMKGQLNDLYKEKLRCAEVIRRTVNQINSLWGGLKRGSKDKILKIREKDELEFLDNAEELATWFDSWIDEVKPGFLFPDKQLIALRELSKIPEIRKYGEVCKQIQTFEDSLKEEDNKKNKMRAKIKDALDCNSQNFEGIVVLIEEVKSMIRSLNLTGGELLHLQENRQDGIAHVLEKLDSLSKMRTKIFGISTNDRFAKAHISLLKSLSSAWDSSIIR